MIDAGRPSFPRRFWPLAIAGLIGVASLPLVILPTLEVMMAAGLSPTRSLATLAALSLIQPAVLVVAGAALGAALAPRLGFVSHRARVNVAASFGSEVRRAIAAGLVAGVIIVALDVVLFRQFTLDARSAHAAAIVLQGLAGGVLYGGLSEEIMMRWGLMTLLVWFAARFVARRGGDAPPAPVCVVVIVVVALLFAAGHLPAASAVAPLTGSVVARILLLNGVAGLVFGWLYWKASLEAAMLAHASVHVVFAVAQLFGWT
jgi:hypothetical protein